MAGYDDLPDAWKKALQPHSELQQAPPASSPPSVTSSGSNAPPASTTSADAPPSAQPGHLDPIAATVHRWLGLPTPDAAPMPAPGSDAASQRDMATAAAGGMYNVGSDIVRNLGGTPNPLSADAQTAMQAHPYATTAGSLLGGTAAAIPVSAAAEFALPFAAPVIGTGLAADVLGGAATGAAQNALAGNPDESLARRTLTGAGLGAGLGAIANKVGGWFGAGRSIEQDVANAAKTAQDAGVTDIKLQNLPGGNIKATGATPTYEQSGQIDNAVSKILGDDVPDFKPANLNAVKNRIGGDVSKAANSGQINVAPGGAVDQALTQVQQFANANGAGSSISPLINQIRSKIKNGVISGQDFDNLVGSGSVLHDLTGDDNPYVKQAAQALDKVMDTGFQASSPAGAYDAWVDARTKYRALMGVQKAVLPNGHVNPTTLFNSVQNRFTDLKGTPVTSNAVVGKLGEFADAVRTLFGGGAAAPTEAGPGLLKTLGIGGAGGAAGQLIPEVMSGNILNPENYLTPTALTAAAVAGGSALARYAGQAYQRSPRFVNALINAGGSPIGNPLSQYLPAIGTQAFPQRQRNALTPP